ncbi:MAG: response regulator [Desulfobacteraceae bacterium]
MANILIVTDKTDLVPALEKKGHKLFYFTEKKQALDCARTQPVGLAILDPDLIGLAGMAELRQINPELRMMIVNHPPRLTTMRQAISLGVQEILVEPLDLNELESKVTKVLKATKRTLKEAIAL